MAISHRSKKDYADLFSPLDNQGHTRLIDDTPFRAGANINGTKGNDVLKGTANDDVFDLTRGGNDRASGLGGYDYFIFGKTLSSADRIDGGAGQYDLVSIEGNYTRLDLNGTMFKNVEEFFFISGGSYNINLSTDLVIDSSLFSIYGGTDVTQTTSVVDGSASLADLSFFGSSGSDTFTSGSGDDYFAYRNDYLGNDFSGVDVYDGGVGYDRISFGYYSVKGVVIDLGSSDAQLVGSGSVTLSGIEDASGTKFADTLTGTTESNWLLGNGGDDQLYGLSGNDFFEVGAFNGSLASHGLVDGGKGNDVVSFYSNGNNTAAVNVALTETDYFDTGQGTYKLVAIEGLSGTIFDDTLTGNRSANQLFGSDGADHLIGGGGGDSLYGDALYGVFSANGTDGPRTIDPNPLPGFADTLEGGIGKDSLDGGGGADVLIGGADADTLLGGAGADRFVYVSLGDSSARGVDMIKDFASGDLIDVHALDADRNTARNQDFHIGATSAHAGDIVIRYDAGSDTTIVDLFVDANASADMTINLTGNITLTAADFVL